MISDATVIVATVRALKMNGGVAKSDLGAENVEAVRKGVVNLLRHIENVHQFGVPAVVAINHFVTDTEAELQVIKDAVAGAGTEAIVCTHWANGGAGTEELARKVVEITGSRSEIVSKPLPGDDPKQRQPDITRAREKLGWEPKVPVQDGLARTVAYFRELLAEEINGTAPRGRA